MRARESDQQREIRLKRSANGRLKHDLVVVAVVVAVVVVVAPRAQIHVPLEVPDGAEARLRE